jgi:hypothetical protein
MNQPKLYLFQKNYPKTTMRPTTFLLILLLSAQVLHGQQLPVAI